MPAVVSRRGPGARRPRSLRRARRPARIRSRQRIRVPCRRDARLHSYRRMGATGVRVVRSARPGRRVLVLHDHRVSVLDEAVVGRRRRGLARPIPRPSVSNRAYVSRRGHGDAADRIRENGVHAARAARRRHRRRRTMACARLRERAARCERLSRDTRPRGSDVDDLLRMGVLRVSARDRSRGAQPRTLAVGRRCPGALPRGKESAAFRRARICRVVSLRYDGRLAAACAQDIGSVG